MATLKRLSDDVLELDSHTAHEQGWFLGGCLIVALSAIVGVALVGIAADGKVPLSLGLIPLAGLVGGILVSLVSFQLQETWLLSPEGVRLRRQWFGRTPREHMLARCDEIHSLAVEASNRQPRRWRLLLIRHDASTLELFGYNTVLEPEEERWREVCALGEQVARHLVVPLRLPEGEERARRGGSV